MVADVSPKDSDLPISRCELDSHANMIVLGTEAFYFESGKKFCHVSPYDRSTTRTLPIKDGAVAYDCLYTGYTTILIFRNAIAVPGMKYNLIPPFILREAGVTVNEKAKIHCDDPSIKDHSISFEILSSNLRIPLLLNGTFSYFATRMPNVKELEECDKIICSPDASTWNPNCTSFASNEASMLDFEGNISQKERWLKDPMIFEKDSDEDMMFDCSAIRMDEVIDGNISSYIMMDEQNLSHNAPHEDLEFAFALNAKREISSFDSTPADIMNIDGNRDIFSCTMEGKLDELRNIVMEFVPDDKVKDIDAVLSAVAGIQVGPTAEYLSKLWMISEKQAEGAINLNTHLCKRPADNSLSRNFSTNDRMLRYRRINSVFFTDALVATSCKSTRGNKYAQIFVSDKGYIAVFPMKSQSEFEQALHWFCKQVGVPVDLIMDGHKLMSENQNVK